MQLLRIVMVLSAWCWFASVANAEVRTREIEYKQGETVLRGSWRGMMPEGPSAWRPRRPRVVGA